MTGYVLKKTFGVRLLSLILLGFPGLGMSSPGLDALSYFFGEINTFEARFGQIVLDESLVEVDNSQGQMWIQRPGLFRWNYDAPDAQQIVGDGVNLWVYDVELEQVSVRDQDQAIGRSPAILLAGSGDLEDNYTVEDIGSQGRYDWVNLIPKDADSGFREVRIGFEDNRLRLLELLDNLDQRTRISFVDLKENIPVAVSIFDFVPPEGVDVIDNTE
jgi:outer membrane lipoprotein carrier protein